MASIHNIVSFVYFCITFFILPATLRGDEDTLTVGRDRFKIEGKVQVPGGVNATWIASARILVDGGEYVGFLKSDGNFVVHNVPAGSYVLEVANPSFVYEPVRVDITSKGKFRARKVNHLQSSVVQQLPYPVKFKLHGAASYFRIRETWRITDMIFNPMVLMMVAPLLILLILPKMVNTNDPEIQKEMQQSMPKYDMPELSEVMTSGIGALFGGDTKKTKAKAIKKRQ